MKRIVTIALAGEWTVGTEADSVILDAQDRQRRRMVLIGARGENYLLDLPTSTTLHDGDGLILDDDTLVRVVGKPEPLCEIAADSATDLARIAWHIGNRHIDVQLVAGKLRIRRDHVIEAMLARLGARLVPVEAPFDPESGAYATSEHLHDHD